MLKEKILIKMVDFDLNIAVRFIGKQITLCPLKVFCAAITLCSIFLTVQAGLLTTIGSLYEFVTDILWLLMGVVLTFDLVNTCFGPDGAELYEHMSSSGGRGLEGLEQVSDRVLSALVATKGLTFLVSLLVIYLQNLSFPKALFNIGAWLNSSKVLSIAILKHLVAKRLRRIREMAETSVFLDEVATGVREVLKCNDKINSTYDATATAFAISSSFRLLNFCYKLWFTYGMDEFAEDAMRYHPVSTFLYNAVIFISALILVVFCTFISDEIDGIKFELDVSMSARPCTPQHRKLISLLLLELHHKPVQFSALGLFTINRSSLAVVVATVISYMIVFIQFS